MTSRVNRVIAVSLLVFCTASPARPGDVDWEYRAVILQGITAGGSVEKQSSGIYTDTRKTAALNELAADGWEVIAVVGAPGADHTVYLRRKRDN